MKLHESILHTSEAQILTEVSRRLGPGGDGSPGELTRSERWTFLGARSQLKEKPVHPDTDHGVIIFTDAWKQHAAELRQRCLTWTGGNPWDADEAISRTACIIFLKFPSQTQSISDLRAWFLRLTYNACMDLHRERKRRCEQHLDETLETVPSAAIRVTGMEVGDPERRYLDAELQEYLHGRILDLPRKLRDALQLRMQQRSYPEIASHLGIKEAAVRKRVQLAREALHRDLQDYSKGHRPQSGASRRAVRRVSPLEAKPVLRRR